MIIDDRHRTLLLDALSTHVKALDVRINRERKHGTDRVDTTMTIRQRADALDLARDIECSR